MVFSGINDKSFGGAIRALNKQQWRHAIASRLHNHCDDSASMRYQIFRAIQHYAQLSLFNAEFLIKLPLHLNIFNGIVLECSF